MKTSRNTKKTVAVTTSGNPTDAERGGTSEGEEFAKTPGSRYSAVINERDNKSYARNSGPERPSANSGTIPGVSMGKRKTGRI